MPCVIDSFGLNHDSKIISCGKNSASFPVSSVKCDGFSARGNYVLYFILFLWVSLLVRFLCR